jgi:thioredoxin reductase
MLIGQILMGAFILRRVELVAAGMGDVVLIGSAHSTGTLRIRVSDAQRTPIHIQESKITWGFPTGISGQELAARAYLQAQKFGAEILINKGIQLVCNHKPYVVEVENGARIPARTVVIATGAAYRSVKEPAAL